jgi:hypothetical protein
MRPEDAAQELDQKLRQYAWYLSIGVGDTAQGVKRYGEISRPKGVKPIANVASKFDWPINGFMPARPAKLALTKLFTDTSTSSRETPKSAAIVFCLTMSVLPPCSCLQVSGLLGRAKSGFAGRDPNMERPKMSRFVIIVTCLAGSAGAAHAQIYQDLGNGVVIGSDGSMAQPLGNGIIITPPPPF